MAFRRQNNIEHLFVGADNPAVTDKTAAKPNISDLGAGELRIYTPAGVEVTNATAASDQEFVIAQGTGNGGVRISPVIDGSAVRNVKTTKYSAATQQKAHVGYNGSNTLTIEEIDSNTYTLVVEMKGDDVLEFNQEQFIHTYHVSPSTAVGSDIAWDLVSTFNKTRGAAPERDVVARMLLSHAGAAIGDSGDTIVGELGSKTLTVTENGGSGVGTVVAGDFVRLGTATTAEVYKVAASTVASGSGVITLDAPLLTAVNTTCDLVEVITKAQAEDAATLVGVELEGIARVPSVNREDSIVRFDVSLRDFGNTIVTNTATAVPAKGSYQQVVRAERFAEGLNGPAYQSAKNSPLNKPFTSVIPLTTSTFDTITFDVPASESPSSSFSPGKLKQSFVIFSEATNGAGQNDNAEDATYGWATVLSIILGSDFAVTDLT